MVDQLPIRKTFSLERPKRGFGQILNSKRFAWVYPTDFDPLLSAECPLASERLTARLLGLTEAQTEEEVRKEIGKKFSFATLQHLLLLSQSDPQEIFEPERGRQVIVALGTKWESPNGTIHAPTLGLSMNPKSPFILNMKRLEFVKLDPRWYEILLA